MVRTIEVHHKRERGKLSIPAKKKAWRHEDELRASLGRTITLYGPTEWTVTGKLVNVDQYTIQLSVPKHDNSIFTYYKSALLGFSISEA